MPKVIEDEVVISKTEQEGKDALEAEVRHLTALRS
jgi:hypothetical protein